MDSVVTFEFPRRVVPGYLHTVLGDHYDPRDKWRAEIPPGHRFLIYFHALASTGQATYEPKKEKEAFQKAKKASEDSDWRFFEQLLKRGKARLNRPWAPLKSKKSQALSTAAEMGHAADKVLDALDKRQECLSEPHAWVRTAKLTAPLLTGSGNPHPVENGFAFLTPYGIPYLAGSGIKGVLRRAAEELALWQEDSASWNFFLVWVLFGFDPTSALFQQDPAIQVENPFAQAYEKKFAAALDPKQKALLDAWISALDLDSSIGAPEFLRSLQESKKARERVHWQGLLCFHDAFPQPGAELGVDILNPHHWSYYQGEESPHDADKLSQLSFFLVLKPGARFTFRASLLRRRGLEKLQDHIEDWQALLDKAFERACHWLGFGAKTAVGYGAMVPPTRSADAGITAEDEEKEEGTIQGTSTESSLGQAAESSVGRMEKWQDVNLYWDPGREEVSCTFEGKRASSKDKSLLSEALLGKVKNKKKRPPKAHVEVEHIGGKEYRILKITES